MDPTTPPQTPSAATAGLQPHRGVMILVFGILGIVLCAIFGIVAWVMGSSDLQAMAAGRMDPAGEGLTKAGKICGMIGVALAVLSIIIALLFMVIGLLAAAGAGAAGAAGG